MDAGTLEALLRSTASMPLLTALIIAASTLLLEDAATIAVGLLASQMLVDPATAIAALMIGTVTGDLGLYAAGRSAAGHRWAVRLQAKVSPAAIAKLTSGAGLAIAAARFIPGTRLPIFTASGLLAVPFLRVALIVTAMSAIWTPALFWISSTVGAAGAARLGGAAPIAAVGALGLALLAPKLLLRRAA